MSETLKITEPEIGSPEGKDNELDERFNGLKKMVGSGALAAELSEDRKSIIWRTASDGKVYCVDSVDILFPPLHQRKARVDQDSAYDQGTQDRQSDLPCR